jgi:hypothetical protein
MLGEIALAIAMVADAVDIGKTTHPHPTLGESISIAAEFTHGSCTDAPPARKKIISAIKLIAFCAVPAGAAWLFRS